MEGANHLFKGMGQSTPPDGKTHFLKAVFKQDEFSLSSRVEYTSGVKNNVMEDLAKLFQLGDQEHKGFLIRRDMQRLEGELSLSADQLEAVFDSLDSESQGYLTLDKFLLGYSKHRTGSKDVNSNEENIVVKDVLIPNEVGSLINDISNYMFVTNSTSERMKELSQIISDGQLLCLWEKLLSSLNDDMKRTQEHIFQLENLMNSRETQHKSYVRKLFEDVETQLREEKDRVLDEEASKLKAYKEQMTNELDRRAEDVRFLTEQNSQLEAKLTESMHQEHKYKMLVKHIASDQEVYANQIENLHKSTLDLQNELERVKAEAMDKNQEEYWRGYRTAQMKATFEEDSFVQQLKMLRNMQSILSPDHIDQLATSYRLKKNKSSA
ncbi:hypothetical protein M8J75_002782 [Diaphorina citri]|nr:hypothetical protein M8J75_002782 [Diaphorina citri]